MSCFRHPSVVFSLFASKIRTSEKYDKQDQQGKAAFNERKEATKLCHSFVFSHFEAKKRKYDMA
jgi:hypothetical protein